MAEKQFFRRWPQNASAEYISARQKLLEAEMSLRDQIETVAAQRRALPPGASMPTYSFEEGPRSLDQDQPYTKTTLQQLSEGRSLVIYHLMFAEDEDEACPSCSMWIDGSLLGTGPGLGQDPLAFLLRYNLQRRHESGASGLDAWIETGSGNQRISQRWRRRSTRLQRSAGIYTSRGPSYGSAMPCMELT